MWHRSDIIRALPGLTLPSLAANRMHDIAAGPRREGVNPQELLRRPKKADSTFSLTDSGSSKESWPSTDEFRWMIMAEANDRNSQPYPVPYPHPGDELSCPGKYCGWNGKHIDENKGSLFYVIDDLNRKGLIEKRPIADWEKQLLFAIAMEETETMSGGDLSRCCGDDENFSVLNVNWKCLEYARYKGSQADLRKKDDEGKLREVLPYFMKWIRGDAKPEGKDQIGADKGQGLASALNFHRGGPCGYCTPSNPQLNCQGYRNAIASLFYLISKYSSSDRKDNIWDNDMRIGIDVPYTRDSCRAPCLYG